MEEVEFEPDYEEEDYDSEEDMVSWVYVIEQICVYISTIESVQSYYKMVLNTHIVC